MVLDERVARSRPQVRSVHNDTHGKFYGRSHRGVSLHVTVDSPGYTFSGRQVSAVQAGLVFLVDAVHGFVCPKCCRAQFSGSRSRVYLINDSSRRFISVGLLCISVGMIIVAIDCVYPHKFSTILEVDYDTPYDRHIIIEDSIHRKKRVGKSLEEPEGLGRRILRLEREASRNSSDF